MKTKEQDIHEFIASLNDDTVTYDPKLDKNKDVCYFPEKIKKAKAHLAKVGMPKEYYEQQKKQKENNEA